MSCKLRDHFTRVNALNGHVFGNKCLRSFGQCKHLMQIINWWLNSFVMGFMWGQFWVKWASIGKERNSYCTGQTVVFLHIFADITDKSTKTIPFRFQQIFVTLSPKYNDPLYTSCRFHFHATVVQEVNLCQTGDKLLLETCSPMSHYITRATMS